MSGEAALPALRRVPGRPYLRQDAADELRRYVLAAGLRPGDRLPSERELGQRLGLSRTSVREAMRFLEHEGLVEVRQGRPAVVRPFDLAAALQPVLVRLTAERHLLRDLLAVRAPLEVLAAREAAGRRRAADLAELRRCLEAMRAHLDGGEDTLEEDVLFHRILYRAAGNAVLLAFSRAVQDLLTSVREAARQVAAPLERSWRQHTAIYDAVAAGDAATAGAAMERHMEGVAQEQTAALRLLERVASGSSGAAGAAGAVWEAGAVKAAGGAGEGARGGRP